MNNSSNDERLVWLQAGLVVPAGAYVTALDVERAGHRLVVEGEHLYLERGPGLPLDDELAARVRQWKYHLLPLMKYTPSDSHLRDNTAPYPEHGPIVTRRPL